jgi:hypothetical protein
MLSVSVRKYPTERESEAETFIVSESVIARTFAAFRNAVTEKESVRFRRKFLANDDVTVIASAAIRTVLLAIEAETVIVSLKS